MQTLPRDFAKRNGLDKGMHEIVLMNEEGKSWESEVRSRMSGQVFIVGGWKSLCSENKLKGGDSCTFKLLQNAKTPVFQLCSRIGESRFVKLTPTLNSLEIGKQVTFRNLYLWFLQCSVFLILNTFAASTGKFHEREWTHTSGGDNSGGQRQS